MEKIRFCWPWILEILENSPCLIDSTSRPRCNNLKSSSSFRKSWSVLNWITLSTWFSSVLHNKALLSPTFATYNRPPWISATTALVPADSSQFIAFNLSTWIKMNRACQWQKIIVHAMNFVVFRDYLVGKFLVCFVRVKAVGYVELETSAFGQ